MSYLDRLKDHISENTPPDQPLKPLKPGLGGLGGNLGGHISENYAAALFRDTRRKLDGIDWSAPIPGYDTGRASALRHDAVWLLENFASRAFRDGWAVGELFGLWPDKPGWGGIADRLDGSRSLKMTADRAHWRCAVTGEARQFNRGAYGDLRVFW